MSTEIDWGAQPMPDSERFRRKPLRVAVLRALAEIGMLWQFAQQTEAWNNAKRTPVALGGQHALPADHCVAQSGSAA